jgi:hypothetical protein
MMSRFEPDRTELQVGNPTLQTIKERAMEVGYTLARQYQTTNQLRSSANCNTEVQ